MRCLFSLMDSILGTPTLKVAWYTDHFFRLALRPHYLFYYIEIDNVKLYHKLVKDKTVYPLLLLTVSKSC